jgi:hypothetical protein
MGVNASATGGQAIAIGSGDSGQNTTLVESSLSPLVPTQYPKVHHLSPLVAMI